MSATLAGRVWWKISTQTFPSALECIAVKTILELLGPCRIQKLVDVETGE
jgi:hypothetical protein